MTKRPKHQPALTDAQAATLIASIATLDNDLVPLMAGSSRNAPTMWRSPTSARGWSGKRPAMIQPKGNVTPSAIQLVPDRL